METSERVWTAGSWRASMDARVETMSSQNLDIFDTLLRRLRYCFYLGWKDR